MQACLAARFGAPSFLLRSAHHAHPIPSPETLAVVDMGSNSFRLEVGRVEGDQIFRLDTWRENLRIGASIDERGRTRAGSAARGACLPRAFRRAHQGTASVGSARGGDQHLSRGDQRRGVHAAGRARARIPHRHHHRPRGSAAHLQRRRPCAARVDRAAARHRHRRRIDRIHHRSRPRTRAPRVAADRLRRHDAALFRRRPPYGAGLCRRRHRGAYRNRNHRRRFPSRALEESRSRHREPRWRSPKSSSRTVFPPPASRPTVSRD